MSRERGYTPKDVSSIFAAIQYANKHLRTLEFKQTREGRIQDVIESIPNKIVMASQLGWHHFSLTDVVDQNDFYYIKSSREVRVKANSFTEALIEVLKQHSIRCYATWHVCMTANRGWRYTLEGQF